MNWVRMAGPAASDLGPEPPQGLLPRTVEVAVDHEIDGKTHLVIRCTWRCGRETRSASWYLTTSEISLV